MSLIPSKMIPLGTVAPDFILPDVISQEDLSLSDIRGKNATVIMFLCNHCPYVQHLSAGIVALSYEYMKKDVSFAGISANDVSDYPQDGPEMMRIIAQEKDYSFCYLYDETQDVARAYGASCTPDFFIFDGDLKLSYHGQFDRSRPENNLPVTGESFRAALDALIAGEEVPQKQLPSIGCSIKWKS